MIKIKFVGKSEDLHFKHISLLRERMSKLYFH